MKTGNGKTGRPISFDKEADIEAAIVLLGERGFEGTSMALTDKGDRYARHVSEF
jgi:AcrR family transcriptional regulator